MIEESCSRCRRSAPGIEASEYVSWEVDEVGALICPGCLTHEEQRAIAEDFVESGSEIARRQEWGESIWPTS